MLGEVSSKMKGESRKTLWASVIALLVVLAAVGGYFAYDHQQKVAQIAIQQAEREQATKTLDEIKAQNQAAQQQEKDALDKIAANQNKKTPEALALLAAAKAQLEQAKESLAGTEARRAEAQHTIDVLNQPPGANPSTSPTSVPAPSAEIATGPKTPEQIHADNVHSVILIEAAWKVTDTGTGAQIYLYHHKNDSGACPQASRSDYLPMFIEDQGTLSPVLSTLPNDGHNTPIVGTTSGSGFIVGGEGFFLTNRHVLAPWRATWNVADFTKQTVGLKVKNNSIVGCVSASEFPSAWVPSEGSKMVVDKMESVMNPATGQSQQQSTFSDRLKYNPLKTTVQGEAVINATFAKTTQRYRATSVALSEKHDIALGKVDLPGGGKAVTMFADSDAIRPGQPVVVMGYPAISPDVFGIEVSHDMFTNRAHLSAIADPTLTTGPVSKVILSGNSIRGVDGYVSGGEVYQLGINTTGAGNSGGPVFNEKGHVIAVFYAGRTGGGASVTYAVPVKFGKELIDNPSLMK
jgi:S1-C subfamily serine protease